MITENRVQPNVGTEHPFADREEVVELYILMAGKQLRALEQLAEAQGVSIGGIMRRSIRDLLVRETGPSRDGPDLSMS